jgi:NitT/TauT family transport system substrate-binding protein
MSAGNSIPTTRRTLRRRTLLSATAAFAVASPALAQPRHIRFAYNGTGICTAAVPVALHRGYFERNGLDVEFVQLAGSIDQMLQAMATDKADAGGSMLLTWLKPLEQGFDVKLTTGLHGGCTRMLVPRDAGIARIDDLKGKTIGVSSISGSPKHFFSILLVRHGLDPDKDVQWREFPADMLAVAMERNEVQALADSDPSVWLTRLRSNGKLVELASNLSEVYADLSCCTLGVRAELFRSDTDTVARLTRAIREASEHVRQNPDDAAAVFEPYTPKVPVTELAAMLRSHTHDHHPTGAALREEVVEIIADLKRANVIRPNTDPVKLADRIVVDVPA